MSLEPLLLLDGEDEDDDESEEDDDELLSEDAAGVDGFAGDTVSDDDPGFDDEYRSLYQPPPLRTNAVALMTFWS